MGDLKIFNFWCYKVLPLVYDDSLSYYEVLKKAKNKNMNTKDYLSFLGFTVDNKKQIIYSEDELINNLLVLHILN